MDQTVGSRPVGAGERTIMALFDERAEAESARDELERGGIPRASMALHPAPHRTVRSWVKRGFRCRANCPFGELTPVERRWLADEFAPPPERPPAEPEEPETKL